MAIIRLITKPGTAVRSSKQSVIRDVVPLPVVVAELVKALPGLMIEHSTALGLPQGFCAAAFNVSHDKYPERKLSNADLWASVQLMTERPAEEADRKLIVEEMFDILVKWFDSKELVVPARTFLHVSWIGADCFLQDNGKTYGN